MITDKGIDKILRLQSRRIAGDNYYVLVSDSYVSKESSSPAIISEWHVPADIADRYNFYEIIKLAEDGKLEPRKILEFKDGNPNPG